MIWGEVVRLGFAKWRHGECYPGSLPWLEYFKGLPEHLQTTEGKLLWAYRQGPTLALNNPLEETMQ